MFETCKRNITKDFLKAYAVILFAFQPFFLYHQTPTFGGIDTL